MIASDMGDLQTYFFLALLGGSLIAFAMILAGVGMVRLVGVLRSGENLVLASLIGITLVAVVIFLVGAAAALVLVGTGHAA